ncbi:hypothetical protein [Clostridium kluyveri]|uniref:Uncharacterized protein n=1 Tax=Clostridium kluyveri TaxID=1534 RepID=A0A1L5F2W8_CLOKL|nr:hypothetical protein [Clostridium kluyveri]APM37327.1 hypothetical protein BS101_00375 [Clostridium kluyveri]
MNDFNEVLLESIKYNPDIKVKVEHPLIQKEGLKNIFDGYMMFSCIMYNLSLCFKNEQLAEIIKNGQWYLKI